MKNNIVKVCVIALIAIGPGPGCASNKSDGKAKKDKSESVDQKNGVLDIVKKVIDGPAPKWESTGDADVDQLGTMVIGDWATQMWMKAKNLQPLVENAPLYNKYLHSVDAKVTNGASEEVAHKQTRDEVLALPDGKIQLQKIDDGLAATKNHRGVLSGYLQTVVPKIPEASQSIANMSQKLVGLSPELKKLRNALGSVKQSISDIQDISKAIARFNNMDKYMK